MTDDNKNSIQDNVQKAIVAGKITMRPKWHFVLRTALLILGIILIALTLLYLASFIVFILRQTGVLFVPGFGPTGINVFFMSIPWLLVLIALLFIILLEILIRKYSFGYGKPLLYSALAILLLVILGGFLVEMTPLHRGLFRQAEERHLPFAGGFYRQFGEQRVQNITTGVITELTDTGYKIESRGQEIVVIIVTPQTQLPPNANLMVSDKIVVLGPRIDNVVTAIGIKEFNGEIMPHRGGPPPGLPLPQ